MLGGEIGVFATNLGPPRWALMDPEGKMNKDIDRPFSGFPARVFVLTVGEDRLWRCGFATEELYQKGKLP